MHYRLCSIVVYILIRMILFLNPTYFETGTNVLKVWLAIFVYVFFFFYDGKETNCKSYSTRETCRWEIGELHSIAQRRSKLIVLENYHSLGYICCFYVK